MRTLASADPDRSFILRSQTARILRGMKKLIAALCVAAALGAGAFALDAVGPASAADTTDSTAADPTAALGSPHVRRAVIRDFGRVAADTIGVTADELRDAVRGGQSVVEVATAHNVDPATVKDALVTEGNRLIDKASANGRIDQPRADQLRQRLPAFVDRLINWKR